MLQSPASILINAFLYLTDADYWNDQAQESIEQAIALETLNIAKAKNIIFFLGDGMGVPTVTAARIRQGQLRGETGEENSLAWDTFPYVGLIKVGLKIFVKLGTVLTYAFKLTHKSRSWRVLEKK